MSRPTDYDYAVRGGADIDPHRKPEDAKSLAARLTAEAMRRSGIEPEPEEAPASIEAEAPREDATTRMQAYTEHQRRKESGEEAAQESWDRRAPRFLAKLGLASDDERVIALAQRRWVTEAEFWDAVSGLVPAGRPTPQLEEAPAQTPGLDEAREELTGLLRNPGVNTKREQANRARRAELTKIIAALEAGGFGK